MTSQQHDPRQPRHRRRTRALQAGTAAAIILAGGGAVYALAGCGSPAKPLTCKQQFSAWKNGPAHAPGEQLNADVTEVRAAAGSVDIPAAVAALKALGAVAVTLQRYPMPACADPAGYWTQELAKLKAAGDNAGAASGVGGILLAEEPLMNISTLDGKLNAELQRTAGAQG